MLSINRETLDTEHERMSDLYHNLHIILHYIGLEVEVRTYTSMHRQKK